MAWKVPPDRKAAVAWFRSRIIMTDKQFAALSADAKAQAFTVGGVTQLSVVQLLLEEMSKSVKSGRSFEVFRQNVRRRLKADFGKVDSARLKTAFALHTQRALNAGRWAAMNEPEVIAQQPYRVYDAVLDLRTSKLCRSLHGTVVPHDSEVLRRYWPPLHWNCRTSVRAITTRTARKHGITDKVQPPETMPEGFGRAPDEDEPWEPQAADYEPDAWAVYQKRKKAKG